MEYTLNILRYVSVNADSWNNKNAFTTSRYWLEKLFLILEDAESDILLTDRVWLDETYYSVRAGDNKLKDDGLKPRGLSQNQICIGVACDKEHILCICEGLGQPTGASTYSVFRDHIKPGSVLVHDKSAAHGLLISELGLIMRIKSRKENILEKTMQNSENCLYGMANKTHKTILHRLR